MNIPDSWWKIAEDEVHKREQHIRHKFRPTIDNMIHSFIAEMAARQHFQQDPFAFRPDYSKPDNGIDLTIHTGAHNIKNTAKYPDQFVRVNEKQRIEMLDFWTGYSALNPNEHIMFTTTDSNKFTILGCIELEAIINHPLHEERWDPARRIPLNALDTACLRP